MRKRTYERRSSTVVKPILEPKAPLLRYFVGPGNNSSIIHRVLSTRKNWEEVTDSKYLFINMRWQQSSKGYNYDNCVDTTVFRHSLNHLEFHQELSNKENLFKNLIDFCEANKMNVYSIVPLTFCLNLGDSNFDSAQNSFLKIYEEHLPDRLKSVDRKQWLTLPRRRVTGTGVDRRASYHYSKPEMPQTFLSQDSDYLWILKPTSYNRGNGIKVFSSIKSLEDHMKSWMDETRPNLTKSMMESASSEIKKRSFRIRDFSSSCTGSGAFVVQKYLEKPLLIDGRKFDIRVWVLFDHEMKVTCSTAYSLKADSIDNIKIHLTNNAVQKNMDDYGKFEQSNQLSFRYLRNYLSSKGGDFDNVIAQFKRIVKMTALSVRRKINKCNRQWCFQVFGYDFMIDEKFKPWLIEVNTNPCLEESSLLLENLLPRMLDDTFKLTIDQIFKLSGEGHKTKYVLQNYQNDHNLWDEVVDLRRCA